jgi:O-methyltransferase
LASASTIERLASGELNEPLRLRRIVRQPRWLLGDLAPMRAELLRPLIFLRGLSLWLTVRQQGFTMVGCRRGRTLFRLAAEVERMKVPGTLVDCGVWNGGSTALLAAAAPSRQVWAFDSFEGLPKPGQEDGDEAPPYEASCLGREENVRAAFRRFARPDQLRIVKGWFDATLPAHAATVAPIAVLHADGDWYASIMVTLESLYDSISPGGYVVVDDYSSWSGARRAVDDFRAARGIRAPLQRAEASVYWSKSG